MNDAMTREPARVGVRELRQNLSVYLDRVKEGERIEVTEHGRPVALLVPLPPEGNVYVRLVAEGKIVPARIPFREYLRSRRPIPLPPGARSPVELLLEMRDEERF